MKLKIIIDGSLPERVAEVYERHRHEVIRLRTVFHGAPSNNEIRYLAGFEKAVIVTTDPHLTRPGRKVVSDGQTYYRFGGRILYTCNYANSANRTKLFMSLIEEECRFQESMAESLVYIEIGDAEFKVMR